MKEKRLIVNADDFGMGRGITDGIVQAHIHGFLSSTSLMPNMPAAEYAISRLQSLPALGVGVHLNICQGRPILPARDVASLVDSSGNFNPPAVQARKLWLWHADADEIEAEFIAQIRWMKTRGIVPTHADSHQHMHMYPGAVKPFARALAAEGIHCARAPRCSVWPRSRTIGGPHEGMLFRRVLVQWYRSALQLTVFRKLDMPQSRLAFLPHERRNLSLLRERWKAALENLPQGTFELACHPGLFEPGFSEADRIRAQREEELRWLTDSELCNIVKRNGIRLITYDDLADVRATRSASADAPALGGSV
jgi:chitin disaccharide deacetylase